MQLEPEQSEQWQLSVGYVKSQLRQAIPGKQITFILLIQTHLYFRLIDRVTSGEVTI
jgi:hypothetical protein